MALRMDPAPVPHPERRQDLEHGPDRTIVPPRQARGHAHANEQAQSQDYQHEGANRGYLGIEDTRGDKRHVVPISDLRLLDAGDRRLAIDGDTLLVLVGIGSQ